MKKYGLKRGDRGCCPGHDKFPHPKDYIKKPKCFKRKNRSMKKRERQNKEFD